ncbi:MAG: NAD-dependent epimerase/dehydratase family protein [Spirochaetaceae bacterium]
MRVLVTGPDGLLGSSIVRTLLEDGHEVRALVQPGRPSITLDGLAVERHGGDILDSASVADAVRTTDAVIHAAASTSIWPPRAARVREINIEGTRIVLDAAERRGLERFVYIGTANSFAPGSKADPGDERGPYHGSTYGLDYMDSKYEAQQLVLSRARAGRIDALTVNPTFMIGPYDSTPSSGMMLIRLYQGRIPGYTAGGKSWVHSRDVARAAANALTRGTVGESYIAGNENLSYREFFEKAASVMGVEAPRRAIPRGLSLAMGALGSAVASLSGKAPLISRQVARLGTEDHYYTSEKARSELLMPVTPIEDAILDSFTWLRKNGYLEGDR